MTCSDPTLHSTNIYATDAVMDDMQQADTGAQADGTVADSGAANNDQKVQQGGGGGGKKKKKSKK
jgi:hypothetical protein